MLEKEEPAEIAEIREKKGKDFLEGARRTIEKVAELKPGEKVLIAGTKSHEPFLTALHHYATQLGANSKLVITDHLREGTPEQERMVQAAKEHKPDVFLFALTNNLDDTTGRFAVYDAVEGANPKAFTVTMPGITDEAVRNYIPKNPDKLRIRVRSLARELEKRRGEQLRIETVDHLGNVHTLTARIPDERDEERFKEHATLGDDGKPQQIFKILADDQTRREGELINLPAGEVYFQPMEMEGEAYLAPGSIIMDHGVVKEGMLLKIVHNADTGHSHIVGVEPIGEADRELAEKLKKHIDPTLPVGKELDDMKKKVSDDLKESLGRNPTEEEINAEMQNQLRKIANKNVVAEHGIGVNDLIKSATGNLIGEKINATVHLGEGDNHGYGTSDAGIHGDIVFWGGKLYIGEDKLPFVDIDKRKIPLLDE